MKYRHILIVGLILSLAVVAFGSTHPYISDPGTLLDGFENVADWSVSGTGATAENDATLYKQGTQSIKLNATNGNWASLEKRGLSLDLSSGDGFPFWFYVHDATKLISFTLFITSENDYSKYFSKVFGSFFTGWNYLASVKSEFSNTGEESWNNTMVRMKFKTRPEAGQDASVSFDDLRFGVAGLPKVILTFDDNFAGQRDEAYPIMSANGQKGVAFICHDKISLGDRLSLADMQMLRDNGWDICNHTISHPYLTTISQEELETEINGMYDYLVTNGFKDTAKFFAYPMGQFNDAVIAKVKQRHVLAREVSNEGQPHFRISNYDDLQFRLTGYYVQNTTSTETLQGIIDREIERCSVLILMFHNIVDADAGNLQYLTADFQTISDYLKTKQDAGDLEVITFSDYYNAIIELEPFCLEEPAMDFNGDCKVDFADFAQFAQSWLECNLDPESACWEQV